MRLFLIALFLLSGLSGVYLLQGGFSNFAASRITPTEQASIERDLGYVFKQWTEEDKPEKAGLMAVFPSGDVKIFSHGGMNMKRKRPVASVSKAVTGLCVAGLIMDGRLKLDDKLGDVLANYFATYGRPRDRKTNGITIAHLLTHHSGFFGNESRKESKFYQGLDKIISEKGIRQTYFTELTTAALSQSLIAKPGSRYVYSNTNYLVLGLIIEQITGETYETYCSDRVLEYAGVEASLDPDGKILSSYAGWLLSPQDVLNVFALFDADTGYLSPEMTQWHTSPRGKKIPSTRHQHYGLGTVVTKKYEGDWFFHLGKWANTRKRNKPRGSLDENYATMAFYTDEGVGIFAVLEPGHKKKSTRKLRNWIMTSYNRGLQAGKGS